MTPPASTRDQAPEQRHNLVIDRPVDQPVEQRPGKRAAPRRAPAPKPASKSAPTRSLRITRGPVPAPKRSAKVRAVAKPPSRDQTQTQIQAQTQTRAQTLASGPVAKTTPRSKHSGARGKLIPALPSPPALAGIAVLAIAIAGVLHASPAQLVSQHDRLNQPTALSGTTAASSSDLLSNRGVVSRDSRRDAMSDSASSDLVAAAEQQTRQRNAKLAEFAQQVEQRSKKMALNLWVAPTDPIVLTARFGDFGLWSGFHTGLDFNGETGDPIHAITSGTITSVGYDGSYGNKTVETLPDGTELWYCHQNAYNVSVGDTVRPGQVIGYIGSTGHVTGSHLHLEVRPGGGDPVDPYPALEVHGVDLP